MEFEPNKIRLFNATMLRAEMIDFCYSLL